MSTSCLIKRLEDTRERINCWLNENSPYTKYDQKHLQNETPEQAYWHLGYQVALDDILRAAKSQSGDDKIDRI